MGIDRSTSTRDLPFESTLSIRTTARNTAMSYVPFLSKRTKSSHSNLKIRFLALNSTMRKNVSSGVYAQLSKNMFQG